MKTKQRAQVKQPAKAAPKATKAPARPVTVSAFSTTVDKFGPQRQRMDFNLSLVGDLMGGTSAMRKAARRWLPQEAGEEDARYQVRLNRSTFFNGYANCIRSLVGRPFSKPLKPSDKLPPAFLPYLNDVDRAGHSLQVWARDVFASGVSDGLVHWIVEYPDTSNVQNLAEEAGMRPYFVQISAAQVLGFRYHVNDKGEPFLDSLRILEVATKAVDEYTDEEVPQIRVMTPGAWSLWQKPNPASQQWERVKSGRTSLNFIPFVTFAPGSVGFMEAVPPLIDYAWENIGHWQSSSDQRNILHIARVPLYFGAGFKMTTEEGNQRSIRLAANSFVTSEDPNAKISIIEHSGKSIEAGRQDVLDIEDRMSILGFEPLIKKNSNARATATGYMIDAEVEYSELAVWSMIFADCISNGIWMMGQYTGDKVPEEKLIDINTDFGIAARDAADLQALLSARNTRQITQKTFLNEYKKRNVLSETLNVDDEIAATADEAPRFDAGAPDTLPAIAEPGTGGVGDPTNPTGTSKTRKPN